MSKKYTFLSSRLIYFIYARGNFVEFYFSSTYNADDMCHNTFVTWNAWFTQCKRIFHDTKRLYSFISTAAESQDTTQSWHKTISTTLLSIWKYKHLACLFSFIRAHDNFFPTFQWHSIHLARRHSCESCAVEFHWKAPYGANIQNNCFAIK